MKQRNRPVIPEFIRLAGIGAGAATGQALPSLVQMVQPASIDSSNLPSLDQLQERPTGEDFVGLVTDDGAILMVGREVLAELLDGALAVFYDIGVAVIVEVALDVLVIRVRRRHEDGQLLETLLALPTDEEREAEQAYRHRLARAVLDYAATVYVEEHGDDVLKLTVELPLDGAVREALLAQTVQ